MKTLAMLLLSSISIFKCTKWSHRFLTISAASDLIAGDENVTFDSGKVSLIRVFSFRSLSKISLDAERVASFVPMWTIIRFAFLQRIR